MENQINEQNSSTKQTSSWNQSEQAEIVKALTVIINGQKSYGKQASLADTFAYYQLKLDGRFSGMDVLNALHVYTDRKNDLPAPADIIEIINPPKKKITPAEFVHARERHAAEGFPMYGYYKSIIREFEEQEAEDRAPKTEMHPALAERLKQALEDKR